jgi:hemerythrin-like domain-containing protein
MPTAITTLQREHRAIAAVLYCLEQVMREIRQERLAPDFDFFDTIIAYLRDFPDRYHHPKEDDHFFPLVELRAPEVRGELAELKKQHHDGLRLTQALKWKLDAWRRGEGGAFKAFDEAVGAYIEFQRRHIGIEERAIIPAASAKFTAEDWRTVDAVFADNDDPLFGRQPRVEYDRLFSKIAQLAPEPHGLGRRIEPGTAPRKPAQAVSRDELLDTRWS